MWPAYILEARNAVWVSRLPLPLVEWSKEEICVCRKNPKERACQGWRTSNLGWPSKPSNEESGDGRIFQTAEQKTKLLERSRPRESRQKARKAISWVFLLAGWIKVLWDQLRALMDWSIEQIELTMWQQSPTSCAFLISNHALYAVENPLLSDS